uniref:Uncharacterized protein n=1 Tax=Chrysemys picta bellii TaxID=8478 RepID=A0A8C3I2C8_CHRPI
MLLSSLASLILQCILQVLEGNLDTEKNATAKNEPKHKPYDNAYFFILFVMLFYSFLALTVFFGYVRSKKAISKKDPYQEFIEDKDRSKKDLNQSCTDAPRVTESAVTDPHASLADPPTHHNAVYLFSLQDHE